MDDGFARRCGGFRGGLFGALPGAFIAVKDIGASHLVVFAAHQRQLDLVLHVLDVEGPAFAGAARKRAHDVGRELLDDLVHAAGGGSRVSLDREECLGHRHRNLAGVEAGDRAVTPDHLHRRLRFRRGERLGAQLDERCWLGFAIERE